MKKTLLVLLAITVLGGALWYALNGRDTGSGAVLAEDNPERHDFEAQGVVLRQLDADGRLRYEIEAERILQLRDGGGIIASRLTLRHDPPGTQTGSPQRWILTADEATLPADGRVASLSGTVRAHSVPAGGGAPLQLETEQLRYDMEQQQVSADGRFTLTRGGNQFRGSGLRVDINEDVVNIAEGEARIELGRNGTISF